MDKVQIKALNSYFPIAIPLFQRLATLLSPSLAGFTPSPVALPPTAEKRTAIRAGESFVFLIQLEKGKGPPWTLYQSIAKIFFPVFRYDVGEECSK